MTGIVPGERAMVGMTHSICRRWFIPMRKTALLLSALALSTFPLAACGGGGEDAPAPDPAPTAADEGSKEATEATQETSDEAEEAASDESEDSPDAPAGEDGVSRAEPGTDPRQ